MKFRNSCNNPLCVCKMETGLTKPEDIHVMPDDDKHECSEECFCDPRKDYVDAGKTVWVHKGPEELQQ